MLRRLAKERGAVAKVAHGYLLFVPKGEVKSVSGQLLPAVHLKRSDLTRWHGVLADREKYKQVTARWYDKLLAKEQQVHAGSGQPTLRISRIYQDAKAAQKAADARLKSLNANASGTLDIETAGKASLGAETEIVLSGMRDGLNGSWVCDTADHTLSKSAGWDVKIKLERKK